MKLSRFEVVFIILVIAVHLAVVFAPMNALLDKWFTTDDAFYYFQVARNISEGRGSSLDGINPSNGYHPLWMIILIPVFSLARFDLFLPLRMVVGISVLMTLSSGILLYRFLLKSIHPSLAMLTGIFWVFFPPLHRSITQLGMESALNALCVIALISQTARLLEKPISQEVWRDRLLIGVTAVFALFSRLDNVFLVLTVGLAIVFRNKRKFIFWLCFLIFGLVAIYLAFFVRVGFPRFLTDFQSTLYAMIGFGLAFKLMIGFFAGLFNGEWLGIPKELRRVILVSTVSGGLGGVILLGLNMIGIIGSFPRSVVLLDIFFSTLLFLFARRLAVWLAGKQPADQESPFRELSQNIRHWFERGAGYALPVGLALVAYLLLNLHWFGTPTPVSGQVKHWWGTIPDVVYGRPANALPALFGFFENVGQNSWWLFFFPVSFLSESLSGGTMEQPFSTWINSGLMLAWLGLVMVGLVLRIKKTSLDSHLIMIIPLISACLLQILYYTGSYYVNLRPWYWVNHSLVGVLILAFSFDGWSSVISLSQTKTKWIVSLANLVMVGLVLWGGGRLFDSFIIKRDENQPYYLREVVLLEQHTPTGSVIGMPGGGSTAYFIRERTVVNLDGLINSYDYFQHLRSGRGREYLDQLGLDFVFGHPGMVEDSAPYYSILAGRLQPLLDLLEFRLYRYSRP
ncbi:MAG: hypothetical protein N2646_00220 [Bellilinea sp.]|nr:hypothetical protein [Bellilinea sp.]